MKNVRIVYLENEDLLKFSALFYDELVLSLPSDVLMMGAVDISGEVPRAVGLLIFHMRGKSAYIDWLFVEEASRRKGIGKYMLNHLKRLFAQDPSKSIEVVFMNFDETIWGMGSFLKKDGFGVTFFDGDFNIFAPLKSVKLIGKDEDMGGKLKAVPLSEVPKASYTDFENYLSGLGTDIVIGIVGPVEPEDYRAESRAVLDGDRIVGMMLVSDTIYNDTVMIDWAYSIPKFVLQSVPLAFNTVITELRKYLPENTVLCMASLEENVGGIIRKTMPGAVFTEAYSAFWLVER